MFRSHITILSDKERQETLLCLRLFSSLTDDFAWLECTLYSVQLSPRLLYNSACFGSCCSLP